MTLPLWIQIIAVALPAAVSIFAAVWASRSAVRARTAEHEAARLRALEERTAQKKFELYQPMLQAISDMLTPARQAAALARMEDVMPDFQTFVTVWGSDDAVRAWYRFRLASSTSPPSMIIIRLVADFLVEARKDLAWPGTDLTGLEVMGMRINDGSPELREALTVDFNELAIQYEWRPPWSTSAPTAV